MESAKQERTNLLGINYLSKHMSTPLNMGGGKGSGMYMKEGAPTMMKDDTPLAKHTKAQGEKLNPGLVSAIHMHDDFTKKNNIKHK